MEAIGEGGASVSSEVASPPLSPTDVAMTKDDRQRRSLKLRREIEVGFDGSRGLKMGWFSCMLERVTAFLILLYISDERGRVREI